MRFRLPAVMSLAVAFFAAAVSGATGAPAEKPRASAPPNAIVAIIDTGINPYHVTFRDSSRRARVHPSKYLPGYPKDAIALRLSLNETRYWEAVKKDCKSVWSKVKPGRLYWFPGTKIVGAISFEAESAVNCEAAQPPGAKILDYGAHGTMTASRAASVEYGACRDCQIVAVQGFVEESVSWAAENSTWIDAQSNSWGPFLPLWEPAGVSPGALPLVNDPEFVSTVEAAAKKHLSFWATGNGALTRLGVLGHPTILDPRMTPSIVMVGGHDSGYVNLWPDFPPHVVSDSCNSWAAYHDEIDKSDEDVGGGTSGASPFAAGGATRMLLEARRILGDDRTGVRGDVVAEGPPGVVSQGPLEDGKFTLEEWRTVLFKTATARPVRQHEDGSVCDAVGGLVLYSSTPLQWKDVPPNYPEFLHIGYGAVDDPAVELALDVLAGRAELPDRARTDEYFARDAQVRGVLHDVYDGP